MQKKVGGLEGGYKVCEIEKVIEEGKVKMEDMEKGGQVGGIEDDIDDEVHPPLPAMDAF